MSRRSGNVLEKIRAMGDQSPVRPQVGVGDYRLLGTIS